jgi:predicted outer membrane protein
LALENSSNDEVKNFAKKMIADHSQVGQQLAKIAETKGLTVPPTNAFQLAADAATPPNVGGTAESPRGNEQRRADSTTEKEKPFGMTQIPQSDLNAVKKLQDQTGSEFDRAYVSEMVKDHEQTIAKFEQASRSATDPELKRFASDTLSKLREHSHMAEQLFQTVGAQPK